MELKSQNFIKNYFLQKMLDTRLFFIKDKSQVTDFFDEIRKVKRIIIILPINKSEESIAREYLPKIQKVFGRGKLSTLDISTLRRSDTNWLGVPNQQYLSNIQNEGFDLLIDLNSSHNRLCAFLGALTGAPLRLHVSEGKFDKIYNLHIRISSDAPLHIRYENCIDYIDRMRKRSTQ